MFYGITNNGEDLLIATPGLSGPGNPFTVPARNYCPVVIAC